METFFAAFGFVDARVNGISDTHQAASSWTASTRSTIKNSGRCNQSVDQNGSRDWSCLHTFFFPTTGAAETRCRAIVWFPVTPRDAYASGGRIA